ncbi:hypothetical protein GA433_10335 [Bacteroides xylanisolvens]|nr:hypothetical protein GA433_10335 [Bacteroides xylanisolvens]PQL44830.1 hypothetical protein C5Z02_05015 [Bacteroides ovatus]
MTLPADFPIQRNGGQCRRQTAFHLAARKAAGSLSQFVPNWVFRPLSVGHVCLMALTPSVRQVS